MTQLIALLAEEMEELIDELFDEYEPYTNWIQMSDINLPDPELYPMVVECRDLYRDGEAYRYVYDNENKKWRYIGGTICFFRPENYPPSYYHLWRPLRKRRFKSEILPTLYELIKK